MFIYTNVHTHPAFIHTQIQTHMYEYINKQINSGLEKCYKEKARYIEKLENDYRRGRREFTIDRLVRMARRKRWCANSRDVTEGREGLMEDWSMQKEQQVKILSRTYSVCLRSRWLELLPWSVYEFKDVGRRCMEYELVGWAKS